MRAPAGEAAGPVLEVAHHMHQSRKNGIMSPCTCRLASAVTSLGPVWFHCALPPPHTHSWFEANLRGCLHRHYLSTYLSQRTGILSGEKQQPWYHHPPCSRIHCCVRDHSRMRWLQAGIHSSLCSSRAECSCGQIRSVLEPQPEPSARLLCDLAAGVQEPMF